MKLIGKNDVEDALKKLDRLTQEEARMAAAQLLKVTNTIDNRVEGIADNVLLVDNRLVGVDDRMKDVHDDVDQIKRSWSPDDFDTGYTLEAQTSLQGINYDRIFVDGSHHQIRLRTITLHVMVITKEPPLGSSKAVFTEIGNPQQVLNRSSGFMGNVRPSPTPP